MCHGAPDPKVEFKGTMVSLYIPAYMGDPRSQVVYYNIYTRNSPAHGSNSADKTTRINSEKEL